MKNYKAILIDNSDHIMIDEVSPFVTYIGNSNIGTDIMTSIWAIRRVTQKGNIFYIEFADRSQGFDKIWNDRSVYQYM